jgi:hypothetical protein
MRRDKRAEHLQRLHRERRSRAAGRFYGTRATTYGAVPQGPPPRDEGRMLLSLVLLSVVVLLILGMLVSGPVQSKGSTWVHLLTQTLRRVHSGRLAPAHPRCAASGARWRQHAQPAAPRQTASKTHGLTPGCRSKAARSGAPPRRVRSRGKGKN